MLLADLMKRLNVNVFKENVFKWTVASLQYREYIKEFWDIKATVFVNLELRKCSSKTSWVKLICL